MALSARQKHLSVRAGHCEAVIELLKKIGADCNVPFGVRYAANSIASDVNNMRDTLLNVAKQAPKDPV